MTLKRNLSRSRIYFRHLKGTDVITLWEFGEYIVLSLQYPVRCYFVKILVSLCRQFSKKEESQSFTILKGRCNTCFLFFLVSYVPFLSLPDLRKTSETTSNRGPVPTSGSTRTETRKEKVHPYHFTLDGVGRDGRTLPMTPRRYGIIHICKTCEVHLQQQQWYTRVFYWSMYTIIL